MKRMWTCMLIVSLIIALCGCTAGLGKVPSVEADEVEESMVLEDIEEAEPEEIPEGTTNTNDSDWHGIRPEDLSEPLRTYCEETFFEGAEEIPSGAEQNIQVTADGISYQISQNYMWKWDEEEEGEDPIWILSSIEEEGSILCEPTEADITYEEAIQKAQTIAYHWYGEELNDGWKVSYVPAETRAWKYDGRSLISCAHFDPYITISFDGITGEIKYITFANSVYLGFYVLNALQLWGESEGLDVTEIEKAMQEGEAFANSDGPVQLAQEVAEKVGLKLTNYEQEPMEITFPEGVEQEYKERTEEAIANGEISAYAANEGWVYVDCIDENGDSYRITVDSLTRTVTGIVKGWD